MGRTKRGGRFAAEVWRCRPEAGGWAFDCLVLGRGQLSPGGDPADAPRAGHLGEAPGGAMSLGGGNFGGEGMANTLVLLALTGDLRGQEFALTGPAHWVLGRSRGCALRLPGDGTVSRRHCLIELDEAGAWVQDLGSLNGTLVNGEKVGQGRPAEGGGEDATVVQPPRRHRLRDGDELRVCGHAFAVVLRKAAAARPAGAAAHGGAPAPPDLAVWAR